MLVSCRAQKLYALEPEYGKADAAAGMQPNNGVLAPGQNGVFPEGLSVVPGVAQGEGCSAEGGCASCPYMKMNTLA